MTQTSRIARIRATPVTVPLEAPIRHSNGAHWGRFVRTLVEVETDDGYLGLGEFGGGGETASAAVEGLISYLKGHDVFRLEAMRFAICNPTASLYNNRTQMHAALEFACLDFMGQKLGLPVSELLGGRLRDSVEFASYLFYRYRNEKTGEGEVRTPEQLVLHAQALKQRYGFSSHKLKSGVFHPRYELECYQALGRALDGERMRYDPNCALSLGDAIEFGRAIENMNNDYYEDPVWGGIRPCIKAAGICETFGIGVAVHSSGELGVQWASMLHLGAVVPNLGYAADAHYHHLVDDVIEGGKLNYVKGRIAVPSTPGLGVKLDADKVRQYHELYLEMGSYPYDRDPGRPGWYPLVPNDRWADPGPVAAFTPAP